MAGAQPEVWAADVFGSQQGHGSQEQACLAHQVRDMQYTIDTGNTIFAPAMLAFLQRVVQLVRKRVQFQDGTMPRHRRELPKRLAVVLELEPTQADGIQPRKRYRKARERLLVFMSAVFRKVTNGFRVE